MTAFLREKAQNKLNSKEMKATGTDYKVELSE